MATSLKVTLELDDRGYVTRIKGAVSETDKLAAASKKVEDAGVSAFTKLGQNTEVVIGKLKALAIAYVGVSALKSGFGIANDLDDLSKATEISIQKILQFQTALIAAGGKGEDAARMITNLTNTLQSARDGSSSAQEQMLKLGFSFSEMANLSPGEALQKTINALAKMTNPVERNALAFQLLGKQAALIQWDEVSAGIAGTAEKYDDAARSAAKAAELMNNFDLQMKAMKNSLVVAIEPLSEMFKYLDQLSGGGEGGFVLKAFKTVFETVAILAVNISFIVKAIVDEVTTLYEQAKTVLSNPFKTENWSKAADIHEQAMARAKENALKLEEAERRILGISKQKADEEAKAAANVAKPTAKAAQPAVQAYYAPQIAALKQMTAEYQKQENLIGSKLRQATANIGLGEDQKALIALTEVTQRYNDAQEALIKKRDALAAGPQTEGSKAQIAEINALLKVQAGIYDEVFAKTQKDIAANNERISQDKLLNNLYNDRIALQDRLGALQDESAKVGLTTLAKKYYDIETAAKRAADAEIRSEEVRRFGIEVAGKGQYKLTDQQKKDIYDAANERVKAEQEATKQTYEAQRTFAAGWKEAFNSYVENATNAALQAQSMFQTITKGLEDLIVNFVTTGKLNFKDFANTIIAEFARIQAKKIVAGLFGGAGTPSGGDVFSLLGGLLGRATGGAVNGNTPYLVGEQGPELFVPNTAGKIVANGNVGTSVTYNIQAVDASSFRQLVASDPEFIYAVTEKGRSSVPYRR